ncbi:DNA-binding transcriptional regulator YhcF (GntR family) [Friedmanniella endophytica]|uniref:DNA-binding transcriptional regulator YhcF (GntR family) n=1 Tax=Microlunatus kandeliicorticis TaxID=1759536 RepID=A0A7W3INQ0_9ACTN|nr:GntR family transcriptional regulator [Microlunatus kandeliicorticis]MBA8792426.1 DNA-binding transcriptional regulator YhcF (GntR family) [Microlunatus kandeliicorticis]
MTAALRVDPDDPTPPYEQLRRQCVALIGSGALAEGTRLPPIRQLAGDLGVAAGTVARTYRELEQLGLVVSRRGGGTVVRAPAATLAPADRRQQVERALRDAVRAARLLGADDHEITGALHRALQG